LSIHHITLRFKREERYVYKKHKDEERGERISMPRMPGTPPSNVPIHERARAARIPSHEGRREEEKKAFEHKKKRTKFMVLFSLTPSTIHYFSPKIKPSHCCATWRDAHPQVSSGMPLVPLLNHTTLREET
jgi:hypothetical protein